MPSAGVIGAVKVAASRMRRGSNTTRSAAQPGRTKPRPASPKRVADRPDDLVEMLERLLAEPDRAHATAVLASVMGFRDWEQPAAGFAGQFMKDSEWHWRSGPAPVGDR